MSIADFLERYEEIFGTKQDAPAELEWYDPETGRWVAPDEKR